METRPQAVRGLVGSARVPALTLAFGLLLMLPWAVPKLLGAESSPFAAKLIAFAGLFVGLFGIMTAFMLFMTSVSTTLQNLERGRIVVGLWLLAVGALAVWDAHTGQAGHGAWKILVGPWALGIGLAMLLRRRAPIE